VLDHAGRAVVVLGPVVVVVEGDAQQRQDGDGPPQPPQ